jgi:hypothetical protein
MISTRWVASSICRMKRSRPVVIATSRLPSLTDFYTAPANSLPASQVSPSSSKSAPERRSFPLFLSGRNNRPAIVPDETAVSESAQPRGNDVSTIQENELPASAFPSQAIPALWRQPWTGTASKETGSS